LHCWRLRRSAAFWRLSRFVAKPSWQVSSAPSQAEPPPSRISWQAKAGLVTAFARAEPEEGSACDATDQTGEGRRGKQGVDLLPLGRSNNGHLSTLLRHGRAVGSPPPILGLTLRMELPAAWGRLMSVVGGPLALPAGRPCTDRTAVPVAAVATLADGRLRVAPGTVKKPLRVTHHTAASCVRHRPTVPQRSVVSPVENAPSSPEPPSPRPAV
jgi:hypothetical protein